MASPHQPRLDPTLVDELVDRLSDALAKRIIELIRTESPVAERDDTPAWLDANEVAQRLGVSREWVYDHAEELGAARIGSGPRPRLRFPAQSIHHPSPETDRPGERKDPTPTPRRTPGLIEIHDS